MRIAHTADWHMGKRLGFVDRTEDLKRAIRKIAQICTDEKIDVLLVCGDLFDGSTRTELIRDWIEFVNATFNPFLCAGGTILALTGNHDNEHLCQLLRQAMALAVPAANKPGGLLQPGRLYLFPGPTFFRIDDASNHEVQFIVMPSPT
ncbi:MAG TPA: metallophosphoesterase, partial [Tepidisphaeraceae bacterium]